MTPRRILPALAAALLVAVPSAHGSAGSGSGSFGGGGGGGGGYSGGGGSGGPATAGDFVVFFLILAFVVLMAWYGVRQRKKRVGTRDRGMARKRDRKTAGLREARTREVYGKAFVAAEDDPWFASDAVVAEAEALFREVQDAWDRGDTEALAERVGDDLMTEWSRRLADFRAKGWRNRIHIIGEVRIEYVGLTNREDDAEDRVVVRVSCDTEDYVETGNGSRLFHDDLGTPQSAIREFWTLGRRRGRWWLVSIEQELEGEHQLRAPIVADPADDSRLADEALVEMASRDRVPGERIAALAAIDFSGSAMTEARDLSLVDRRFDPGVIEAAARRAVAAWAEAVDGDDAALLAIADPAVVREMLHPGDPTATTRLVVRGPRISVIHVLDVEPHATPPLVRISADVTGVRFVENRDTTDLVWGDRNREQRFTTGWTLALSDADPATPWRLVSPGVPAPPATSL